MINEKGPFRVTRATLTATIWREGDVYVSLCPELGVASSGDTPDEALVELKEAVELYLENARQLGIWEDIRPAPLHLSAISPLSENGRVVLEYTSTPRTRNPMVIARGMWWSM